MDFLKTLNDLKTQRATFLGQAETAMAAENEEDYDAAMAQVSAMDAKIGKLQKLIDAQQAVPAAPAIIHKTTEAEDLATERAQALQKGDAVTFDNKEVMDAFTLSSGVLVEPTAGGTEIRDRLNPVQSIIDDVYVTDLTGTDGIEEPYVKSEQSAQAGTIASTAGTARTASDPVFRKSAIKPYNVDVTTFVDRNISRLSPVAYMTKIQQLAMKAMRRKVAGFIVNGDGEATHVMHGIKNAVNTSAENLFSTIAVAANGIDVNTLDNLYFGYGGDDEIGGGCRLYLTKADLKTIGELRGTNEKGKLFAVTPDPANSNRGTISAGGQIIPYAIHSGLTSITGAVAGAAAIQTMLYGNPMAYELGLFGGYTIRVDESVKAVERELAILGDVMVGGNLVVDNSFVVATIAATAG